MKELHDYVYADCMVAMATNEDIESLVDLLNSTDVLDAFDVGMHVFAILRRLQVAENLDKASPIARQVYEGMQHTGIYTGDCAK